MTTRTINLHPLASLPILSHSLLNTSTTQYGILLGTANTITTSHPIKSSIASTLDLMQQCHPNQDLLGYYMIGTNELPPTLVLTDDMILLHYTPPHFTATTSKHHPITVNIHSMTPTESLVIHDLIDSTHSQTDILQTYAHQISLLAESLSHTNNQLLALCLQDEDEWMQVVGQQSHIQLLLGQWMDVFAMVDGCISKLQQSGFIKHSNHQHHTTTAWGEEMDM
jgi:hypothetical protein